MINPPPRTSSADVQLAIVQELPIISVSLVIVIAMTLLLAMHIIAIADASPIYYVVLTYFIGNGSARLVASKTGGGTPP